MGMYTELILGCRLKSETPEEIIETLKFLVERDYNDRQPPNSNIPKGTRINHIFRCSSYYFGVSQSFAKLWFDVGTRNFVISTRSSIKNYDNEIENLLEWLKPWIESGSGDREMYAIVTYEEAQEPTIYYLRDNPK